MIVVSRSLVLVLAALLASAALARPATAATVCGDADGSGIVTVTDGVQTLRAAAGLSSSCTLATCDVDGGGTITVTDGVNVLRAAAGLPVTLACGGTTPACDGTTVTVSLDVPQPIGAATLVLTYPTEAVTLPGSGDAAAARVTILTSTALFGDGQPNDQDDRVTFSLVSLDGLDDGTLLSVAFDCLAPEPAASAYRCTLSDVFATDGATPITGARCTVAVGAE